MPDPAPAAQPAPGPPPPAAPPPPPPAPAVVIHDSDSEEESGGSGGEGAAEGAAGDKRGRSRRTCEDRWNHFVEKNTHARIGGSEYCAVDTSSGKMQAFLEKKDLTCKLCATTISGARNLANVSRHFTTASHMEKLGRLLKPPPNTLYRFSVAAGAAAPLDVSKFDRRALLAMGAVGCGVDKSNVHKLYSGCMGTLAQMLMSTGGAPASATTVARDLKRGVTMLDEKMKEKLKGKFVAVCVDEATCRLGGRGRPLGLLLEGAGLEPILVDLFWSLRDEEAGEGAAGGGHPLLAMGQAMGAAAGGGGGGGGGGGAAAPLPRRPSEVAAVRIKERLAELGVPLENVTCLMADNSFFGDALANILNVMRARCTSHVLALCFEALVKELKLFVLCTSGLSAVISAGGGTARREALRAAGLTPSSLSCVATRWCQQQDVAAYLLSEVNGERVFLTVRKLLAEHPAFQPRKKPAVQGGGGAAAQPEEEVPAPPEDVEDADKVQVAGQGMVNAGKLLASVKVAFGAGARLSNAGLLETCLVVGALAKTLPAVLTVCGGKASNIPAGLPDRLAGVRDPWLEVCLDEALVSIPISAAIKMMQLPAADETQLIKEYAPAVVRACKAALGQYDKYMPDALAQLQRRLRFEPSLMPEQLVIPPGTFLTPAM
jgi:hypothetical protein